MITRYFALVFGVVFLLIGVAGFIPGLTTKSLGDDGTAHTLLLGLFPVNALHNLVHVAFGIWGIAAYRAFGSAHTYAASVAVIYGILFVCGLIPGLNTMFGLVPLHGHDVWLHAALAVVAAIVAWGLREGRQSHLATH